MCSLRMCVEMAQGFSTGAEREQAFSQCLGRYVGRHIAKTHPSSMPAAWTDGTIMGKVTPSCMVPVYFQEVKAEVGRIRLT